MLRVFLVEDEAIIRETLRDTVPWEQYGYHFVGEAGDGEIALPMIRQTKPDVLITDIRMPFMDGLALSRLVLQEFPMMKVVIISGYDDFEYARQAIDIGVEQYLLKPITKNKLLKVLENIRTKLENERGNYLTQFHLEAQEYEQYARKRFFEHMTAGQLSVQQIYEEAAKLGLDLRAQSYTIAFFSVPAEEPDGFSEQGAYIRDAMLAYFMKHAAYILLRWTLTSYAIIIKGERDQMPKYVNNCIQTVRQQYEDSPEPFDWYVAVGTPTQRLSMLAACYNEVSRLWAYRYILPAQHILTAETVEDLTGTGSNNGLAQLDASKVNPSLLLGVMRGAGVEEIGSFVDEYVHSVSEALESKSFCQYLMLSVRFTAAEYAVSLGVSQQEFLNGLDCLDMIGQNITVPELRWYMREILTAAVHLRDNASSSQFRGLMRRAVEYIDQHYAEPNLSLNRVAREVNISANYLSGVFSQEKGCTLTEYITDKRMEKARELLRTTDKRSGEVALEVGYRDSHYFSFIFKKTQGCTPRAYRAERSKRP